VSIQDHRIASPVYVSAEGVRDRARFDDTVALAVRPPPSAPAVLKKLGRSELVLTNETVTAAILGAAKRISPVNGAKYCRRKFRDPRQCAEFPRLSSILSKRLEVDSAQRYQEGKFLARYLQCEYYRLLKADETRWVAAPLERTGTTV
jgi:hypothetical protein